MAERTATSSRSEQILEVAAELFYEHGYRGVGLRSIAKAVGVQTPSLYHHFASKEDILFELARRATTSFIDEHLPLLEGDDPPAIRLHRLARNHIAYFWEHRLIQEVSRRELRELSEERRTWARDELRRYQHAVRDFIVDNARDGHFSSSDPELASNAVIDAMLGINAWFCPDGRLGIEEFADRYAALIVRDFLHGDLPDHR
jgi:AcrR family transcriptional regulator